jgi:hypothetical protein
MGCVQVILPARCQTKSSCGFFPQGHKNSTLHMWFYFNRKENTLICMCTQQMVLRRTALWFTKTNLILNLHIRTCMWKSCAQNSESLSWTFTPKIFFSQTYLLKLSFKNIQIAQG